MTPELALMSYYDGTERQQVMKSRASIEMSKVPLPPSVVKGTPC